MLKTILLIILTIVFLNSTLAANAENNCCPEKNNKPGHTVNIDINSDKDKPEKESEHTVNIDINSDNNNPEIMPGTLFNYTKSIVELKKIEGINIYVINQNEDSRYNVGYALGKCIMVNNPEYAKDLRAYLDNFYENQSQFNLEDVLEKISNDMPCWIKQELNGLSEALSINNDQIKITLKDIILLNTVVLWTKIPKQPPQAPPAAPTSVTPIKNKNVLKSNLSPVTSVSDQVSLFISLDSTYVEEDFPVVLRTYSRYYNDFFNKYPAVMIYNLDNVSFINIGYAGLVTVLSGINNSGVIINSIQKPDQENIKVIGATSPSINARIAIESAKSSLSGKEILEKQISCLENVYLIVDNNAHYAVGAIVANTQESSMKEFISPGKMIIYNYPREKSGSKRIGELNRFEDLTTKLSFENIQNIFKSKLFYKTSDPNKYEHKNSVFNVIYNVKEKDIHLLMPRLNNPELDYRYAKIDLDDFKIIESGNKINSQSIYEELFND
ncbi:MAG: hypothetical protein AB1782_10540 [Cyanobacteriota bacterium]